MRGNPPDDEEEYGEEAEFEEPAPPPRQRPQARRAREVEEEYEPPPPPRSRPQARPAGRTDRTYVQPNRRPPARPVAPPQRGMSPNVVMGFMGGMIIGLLGLVILLLAQRGNTTPPVAQNPLPTIPAAAGQPTNAGPAPTAEGADAPRISLDDFKKLYDDPAKRPVIIDVRAVDAFDQGHIVGAVSVPESDIDTRYKEIPQGKLVVLYCA